MIILKYFPSLFFKASKIISMTMTFFTNSPHYFPMKFSQTPFPWRFSVLRRLQQSKRLFCCHSSVVCVGKLIHCLSKKHFLTRVALASCAPFSLHEKLLLIFLLQFSLSWLFNWKNISLKVQFIMEKGEGRREKSILVKKVFILTTQPTWVK